MINQNIYYVCLYVYKLYNYALYISNSLASCLDTVQCELEETEREPIRWVLINGTKSQHYMGSFTWIRIPVKLSASRIIRLQTVNKLSNITMLIFPDIKNITIRGGMEWEAGVSRCKLLYTGWINNKVLL